jgi:eukaryotic-like serine/threonine-protein kinase
MTASVSMEGPVPTAAAAPISYGQYLLLEKIGAGGMAEVFRAVRKGPEGFMRVFALKRIIPRHAESREFVEMFCNEARLSALLNHPNLVQVYDFGEVDGSYYLAMEFLKGRTVLSVMRSLHARRQSFPPAAVAYIGRQVALGLAYAHTLKSGEGKTLNLVHRDINPSNIMLLKSGGVKVLDFGIAKAPDLSTHQTQAGLVKGKLSYASPEQLKCKPLDGRSDVFALGVSLWEMLTMQKLFGGKTDYDTVTNVMTRPVRPPSAVRPDVPPALDKIILQALERDPARRPDARQFAARLADYLREARFLEDSLVELLRELFGEHTSRVLTLLPADLVAPGGVALVDAAGQKLALSVPATPAPEVTDLAGSATQPASMGATVAAWRTGPIPLVLAAVAGIAVVSLLSLGPLRTIGGLFSGAAEPAEVTPQAAAASATEVVVELDSRPRGAVVESVDGKSIGRTPVSLHLPRSKASATFVLKMSGYEPMRYEVVPERDQMATLELRPISGL